MGSPLKIIQGCLPLPSIWKATRITGSMIHFMMGSKIERISKKFGSHYVGSVYLSIELCDWILLQGDKEVLNSACQNDQNYKEILSYLIGKNIIHLDYGSLENSIEITFSDGWFLKIFPNDDVYEKDDPILNFYKKNEAYVSYTLEQGFFISE